MAIRLGSTVINVADIERMTTFWSEVLHLSPMSLEPGETFRKLHGERASISLQVADTPVSCRDQMHFDLYSAQQVEEVQRLVRLGATYVRHERDPDDDFVVLRDPEGNEFCVCLRPDDA
jgi:catechol 2,3-dioxygenase-like lactoylglutathione lyase family enzyme